MLPIFEYKEQLLDAFSKYQTLVIVGDTGSGKTTQIPQYLLNLKDFRIGITQPRRIAALSAAKRVAQELKSGLGDLVGYRFRFESNSSKNTRITYLTDGTMVRLALMDSNLKDFDTIILDEAHERSLDTDILFGLLRRAQKIRSDLKVLIMSATLDIEKFSDFFGNCPVFSIPGRMFHVDIFWQKKVYS